MIQDKDFPENIKAVLKNELPATHKMWWVRGVVVQDVQEIERATANPEKQNPGGRLRNLVVQIGDLDNPEDGYDIEIEGVFHQLQKEDIVSLFGHEEKSAKRVSYPRLLLNHSTGYIERCYPLAKRQSWGVLPMVERKYILAAKTPANPAEKLKNLWILGLVLLLPYIPIGIVGGPMAAVLAFFFLAFILAPFFIALVLVWKYIEWIEAQPPFSFEKPAVRLTVANYRAFVNFNRHDLTPLYEKLGRLFYAHVDENPAPEIEFVAIDRGTHTVGALE